MVNGSHSRDEIGDEVLVSPVKDFVSNGDVIDSGLRVERFDIRDDPSSSLSQIGQPRNIAVTDRDGDGDSAVSESAEDVRVGVEDLDAVDEGLGFEEVGDLCRCRKVVSKSSVVHADGICGGREAEEKEREVESGHGFCFWE